MINYKELKQYLERSSKIEYPQIPKLYKNIKYANIIYNNFSGKWGELTAITQYVYEHITLKENEAIKKILLDIAIQEMKHLDILGEIITNLGQKAFYINSKKEYWTGKNIDYKEKNLKEIMKENILAEEMAIKEYNNLIRYTNNIYLRRVYERIIFDEEIHKKIFEKIITLSK